MKYIIFKASQPRGWAYKEDRTFNLLSLTHTHAHSASSPEVDCGSLSNPDNGMVSVTMTTLGSAATYSCNNGYSLIGPAMRTCQANGSWSDTDPTCEG